MDADDHAIAIIGMAGRFPGARHIEQLWDNLAGAVESITQLSEQELHDAGVAPAIYRRPDYVRAAPLLADYDRFDAAFFGYSPRDAALLDPQQRVFLECAWTALEHAGYDAATYPGSVGVYAGAAFNSYLLASGAGRDLVERYLPTLMANDKDYLTTRVAYHLGLRGPAVTVQSACSTSLVAVHQACQALLNGECDLALAGGVAVRVPQRAGYLSEPGGPLSPDGHCRSFDARAQGTVMGSGAGVVVLKPLPAALSERDTIWAVIKGSAVNNDGAAKADFAAPSPAGQAAVAAEALAYAGVTADTIAYVEAHGSATPLGDPIEVSALARAFGRTTDRRGFCALGSVKSNLGHLDAAAGVAGLIKTVLALRHRLIPPTLHFETPNPAMDLPNTPFFVNNAPMRWPDGPHPRRACVHSLGIGGTNAHVVVEQAPAPVANGATRPFQLLVLSAPTTTALATSATDLGAHLAGDTDAELADVAYTLQAGRRQWAHRLAVVCSDRAPGAAALAQLGRGGPAATIGPAPAWRGPGERPSASGVAFLLPGAGGWSPPALAELCAAEPVFRQQLEDGLAAARELSGEDLRPLVLGAGRPALDYARPGVQLPLVFVVSCALAAWWHSWGVRPRALLGHSTGEVTAAHLAGVFDFTDALALVHERARLLEAAPAGAMVSVDLPEPDFVAVLPDGADIACVNAPARCVASGPVALMDRLRERLDRRGVRTARVAMDSAAHTRLLDPVLDGYRTFVSGLPRHRPSLPLISTVTGDRMLDAEALDPDYWVRQLRGTVRFSEGLAHLLGEPSQVVLEVGAGHTLSGLVRAHLPPDDPRLVATSLPDPEVASSNAMRPLEALGRLWLAGIPVDWHGVADPPRGQRVPLPTYPFQRERHWFDPPAERAAPVPPANQPEPAAATAGPTATEQIVTAIWREALGVAELSGDDDFFALGGTSMLVSEIMAMVNRRWGVELSPLTLLESPTVRGFAACIDAARDMMRSQVEGISRD